MPPAGRFFSKSVAKTFQLPRQHSFVPRECCRGGVLFDSECEGPEGRGAKRSGHPLSRGFYLSGFVTLAAEGYAMKASPRLALPGTNLLPDLKDRACHTDFNSDHDGLKARHGHIPGVQGPCPWPPEAGVYGHFNHRRPIF